jgi:quercetin dioxygenase-like cupin family protein
MVGTLGRAHEPARHESIRGGPRVDVGSYDRRVRELDGIRVIGQGDGEWVHKATSRSRELVSGADTGDRWRLGEVVADPDEAVGTHLHPGEAEAIVILEGPVELHGATGVLTLEAGDVVFIPPDTEHGLRTPGGGRWLAVWPTGERRRGPRYGS